MIIGFSLLYYNWDNLVEYEQKTQLRQEYKNCLNNFLEKQEVQNIEEIDKFCKEFARKYVE